MGDIVSARNGAAFNSIARIWSGWNKFRKLIPLQTMKGFPYMYMKVRLHMLHMYEIFMVVILGC